MLFWTLEMEHTVVLKNEKISAHIWLQIKFVPYISARLGS